MVAHNRKTANGFGILSIALSVVPVVYIFHGDMFPDYALTEAVVLLGGIGGSFLAALFAGFLGSRWWFIAVLAAALDVFLLFWFNP